MLCTVNPKFQRWRRLATIAVAASMLCLFAPMARLSAQATITTVAGRGRVPKGVPGPATGVPLGVVRGIAFDSADNLYFVDQSQHRVFKVTPDGYCTIFAGNGTEGVRGDGGKATEAELDEPYDVAVDPAGNVIITEYNSHRVRRVSPDGLITTVAGRGPEAGDGFDCLAEGGPATNACLGEILAMTVDSAGNIYVFAQYRVWRIGTDGLIRIIAGKGDFGYSGDGEKATGASFSFAAGLAVDSAGNVYVADTGNQRVRKIDGQNGKIVTVAGNGMAGYSGDGALATEASFNGPNHVVFDDSGNMYVSDWYAVRRIDAKTGIVTTAAGRYDRGFSGDGEPAANALFDLPFRMAFDRAGSMYVSDQGNHRIRKFSIPGTITTVVGNGASNFSGDGGFATQADLDFPSDVAFDAAGNMYIADYGNDRIRKMTPAGIIATFAGTGSRSFSGDGGPATAAALNGPAAVEVDSAGNVYIADRQNLRIRKVDTKGIITTFAGNGQWNATGDNGPALEAGLGGVSDLAFDDQGSLYIAAPGTFRVRKITPAGIISTIAGTGESGYSGDNGPATEARIGGAHGVSVDKNRNIYVADTYNFAIRKISAQGVISTILTHTPDYYLDFPPSVVPDSEGNLYVASFYYILRVNPLGKGTILVGAENKQGFAGDGGPARNARYSFLSISGEHRHMAVSSNGDLYFADTGNCRIRKISNIASPELMHLSQTEVSYNNQWTSPASVELTNIGTGTLNWRAEVSTLGGGTWLSVTPASGMAPSGLSVSTDIAGMAAGNYSGKVTFHSDGTSNTPQTINASLKVSTAQWPHLAVGGDFGSTLTLQNLGDTIVDGSLKFFDQAGNALSVLLKDSSGTGSGSTGSSFPVAVHPGAIRFLELLPSSPADPLKVGWAELTYRVNPNVAAAGASRFYFRPGTTLKAAAGVISSLPTTVATIPVDNDDTKGRLTGFAIANPDPSWQARIRVVTLNEEGVVVDNISPPELNPLSGHRQMARFLHEILPQRAKFRGSMVLIVEGGGPKVLVVALVLNQGQYTAIPVVPSAPPQVKTTFSATGQATPGLRVLFPHVAVGGGYTTAFSLVNTGSTLVEGNLILTASDGSPMTVSFAGSAGATGELGSGAKAAVSSTPLSIPPGGTCLLEAAPLSPGDPVKAGWARVEATGGELGGVATFQWAPEGNLRMIAGVLASKPLSTATLVLDEDLSAGRLTGYALANPGKKKIKVRVLAVSADGARVTPLSPVVLEPGRHQASFFAEDPQLPSNPRGSAVLIGEGGATFGVVALVQLVGGSGPMYTAIPVTPSKAPNINP